eukprot:scaffold322628_cov30-Tisochrysis_lutea.AAC.3
MSAAAPARACTIPGLEGNWRAPLVDRLADDVHDAAEHTIADRDLDRVLHVDHFLAANETLGGIHRNRADCVLAQVLRHLEHEADLVPGHLKCIEDGGQVAMLELHIDNGTDDLRHLTGVLVARRDRRIGGCGGKRARGGIGKG